VIFAIQQFGTTALAGRRETALRHRRWFSVASMLHDTKEQIAKMKRFRFTEVALATILVLGAMGVSDAQAQEATPYFTIGGTRLVAGKTHNFAAKVYNGEGFTLATGLTAITCKALGTEEAVLLGSNPGNPGKDDEIVVFSQCKLTEGNGYPNCELAVQESETGEKSETIRTHPLTSEQVENVESSKAGKRLLEEFFPTKRSLGLVTLAFTGTDCKVTEWIMTGKLAGEVQLDNASQGNVELGQAPQQRTSWLIKFPAPPISEVWLITGGVGQIVHTGELDLLAENAVLKGSALVLLANTKSVPEPNATWSPLP
jgi:hypothetical protein